MTAEAAQLDCGAAVHHDVQPGLARDRRRLPVDDPELEPEAARADGHRLVRVGYDEVGAPEDVDHVERPGRRGGFFEGRERGDPVDRLLLRIDRDAVVPVVEQRAEDAVRRAPRARRGADDGDPPGGVEDVGDAFVVGRRDRAATLVEIEERDRPFPPVRVVGQCAPSFTYGWPTAAGAMLRPTTPASTMIVRMYGSALNELL